MDAYLSIFEYETWPSNLVSSHSTYGIINRKILSTKEGKKPLMNESTRLLKEKAPQKKIKFKISISIILSVNKFSLQSEQRILGTYETKD
jgi:hypothetical protein